jgi:hypothetical protein
LQPAPFFGGKRLESAADRHPTERMLPALQKTP